MLPILFLLGAAVIGVGLVATYWKNIVGFIKKVKTKIEEKLRKPILGCSVFIKKIGDKYQNRTKHYSKNELGKWKETIVSYEQNEEDVPEEYRKYATMDEEFDLTDEMAMHLKSA